MANKRLREVMQRPWVGPLIALIVVYLVFLYLRPDTFGRTQNLVNMARQTVVVGIAAVGMTMVIVSGGIDLAVGSQVALTTVVVAAMSKAGYGALASSVAGIGVAATIGSLTGSMIVGLRITPFIATLGTMSILRGAAKGLAKEQKIDAPARGLDDLLAIPSPAKAWMVFPAGVWILVATAVVFGLVLRFTRFGRHVFAIGSSEATAILCGVRVRATKIAVYALAGALAGLAGVVEFGKLTVGDPTDSFGLELDVIAAVVIGGGSLSGGEGSVFGAILGALLMTLIKTGATYVGLHGWVQEIVTGVIIILAVAVDRLRKQRA